MVEARGKGGIKIKTIRMEPQADAALTIPAWQTALESIKNFARARVEELKSNHEGEEKLLPKLQLVRLESKTANASACTTQGERKCYLNFYVPSDILGGK